jgi:hypothetical protein
MKESVGNFTLMLGGASGASIDVSMRTLVFADAPLNTTNEAGEDLCQFSILNATVPETYRLSASLLRVAYMVADPTNGRIAFAQALSAGDIAGGESAPMMVPFDGPSASIPSATVAPHQEEPRPLTSFPHSGAPVVPTTATTYAAAEGFRQTQIATPKEGHSKSRDLKIGIGVGVSVGVSILLIIAAVFWRRSYWARRNQSQNQAKPPLSPDVATIDQMQLPIPVEDTQSHRTTPSNTELLGRQVPPMLSHVYPPTAEVEGEELPPLRQPREMYVEPSHAGRMHT